MKYLNIFLITIILSLLSITQSNAQWNIGGNDLAADGVLGSSLAADPWDVSFVTKGLHRMKISSTGNVGIGDFSLTDPTRKLEIANTTNTISLYLANDYNNNGYKYGINNTVNGLGTGARWGIYNSITIDPESAAISYGIQNIVGTAGTGTRYGIHNSSTTASGNSINYGVYSTVSHSGSGAAYGLYSTVATLGTGTHYGVYSSASGSGNYSFYGIGRGYFSDKVGFGITSPAGTVHVKNNEVDLTSGGSVIIGETNDVNLAFDANEIHCRNNSEASTLYLNPLGGTVVINNAGTVEDVSLSSDGALRLGDNAGRNLIFDANEIQARDNGASSGLFLNIDGGNVAIGTGSASEKLTVCGTVKATEVRVESGWCDYVFDEDYQLPELKEVAAFIDANKHLPNIPPAKEVETKGLELGDMSRRMMEKIEHLMLYAIEQDAQISLLKSENEDMKKQIALLMSR